MGDFWERDKKVEQHLTWMKKRKKFTTRKNTPGNNSNEYQQKNMDDAHIPIDDLLDAVGKELGSSTEGEPYQSSEERKPKRQWTYHLEEQPAKPRPIELLCSPKRFRADNISEEQRAQMFKLEKPPSKRTLRARAQRERERLYAGAPIKNAMKEVNAEKNSPSAQYLQECLHDYELQLAKTRKWIRLIEEKAARLRERESDTE